MTLLRLLIEIEHTVDRIHQKVETTMATLQNFKDLLAAIDAETDRIAQKISDLMDKITAMGLTSEQEEEILGDMSVLKARLESLGADPTNPVPSVPPTPPTPPTP